MKNNKNLKIKVLVDFRCIHTGNWSRKNGYRPNQ